MRCVNIVSARLKSSQAGFSLTEIIVAMTLLASAIIGIYSLMAANNNVFEQNSVRAKLLIIVTGILDDIDMRHAGGVTGSSLTSLTPAHWSDFLSVNGVDTTNATDVTLEFIDLGDLATYQIASYDALTRTVRITSSAPGFVLPRTGDVFQIDSGKYLCDIDTVSGSAGDLNLIHTNGCSLSGLVVNSNSVSFGTYRVGLTVTHRTGVSMTRHRQLIAAW